MAEPLAGGLLDPGRARTVVVMRIDHGADKIRVLDQRVIGNVPRLVFDRDLTPRDGFHIARVGIAPTADDHSPAADNADDCAGRESTLDGGGG